eukprot:scaffold5865_cov186-Amphora_coffeaeformis.AAC.5
MNEALQGLDIDVRREYDLAFQHDPQLVQDETPKAKFLRTCGNNPWLAARRLALYWKFRRQCMTPERWLYPMITTFTTKDCCLGEGEVALLQRGIYHYSNHTATGPVVVVNASQNVGFSAETSARILFYLGTILDDVAVQTVGVTVVYAVTSTDTVSHIEARLGDYMAQGLPVTVRRFVVVQNYEPHKQSLVEYLAFRRQLQIQTLYGVQNCAVIASPYSQADLLNRVAQAGIPVAALPTSCGGGADGLCEFLRQRLPTVDPNEMSNHDTGILTTRRDSLPPSPSSRHINKRKWTENYDGDTCNKKSKGEVSATTMTRKPTVHPLVLVDDLLKEIRQAMTKCRRGKNNDNNEKPCVVTKQVAQQTTTAETIPKWETTTAFPIIPATRILEMENLDESSASSTPTVVEEENLDFGFPVLDPWEELPPGFYI